MVETKTKKISGCRCLCQSYYLFTILLLDKHFRYFFEVANGIDPDEEFTTDCPKRMQRLVALKRWDEFFVTNDQNLAILEWMENHFFSL